MNLKRITKSILITLFLAWLSAIGYLHLFQSSFIFSPPKIGTETPENYGAPFERVTFKTADGSNIKGWWVENKESTLPYSLLYCHGNGADLARLSEVSSIFYKFGFDTLLFDYRGYGESDPAKEGISQKTVLEDARAAYAWIKAKTPNQKIISWGHSLGASVSAHLSAEFDFEKLILEGAFSSIPSMAHHRYPLIPAIEMFIHSPFSTITAVQNRKRQPLLMLHAPNDSIVPYEEGQKVFSAAPEPKEWIILADIDHNDFPSVSEKYKERILNWVISDQKR